MEIRFTWSGKSSQPEHWTFSTKFKTYKRQNITPEKFSDRRILLSMFNDIELERKDNEDSCALLTTLDDDGWGKAHSCKEYTAPRKPHASIDAEMGPVLNIEIDTLIDVLGIEGQAPSLSSPGYSVWILMSRGHERFVNEIHRHNSDIVTTVPRCARRKTTSMMCVSNLQNLPW